MLSLLCHKWLIVKAFVTNSQTMIALIGLKSHE